MGFTLRAAKLLLSAAIAVTSAVVAATAAPQDGHDRIGVKAPPFKLNRWIGSPPLEIEDLRGRVLLVRWWTDGCPFCSTSAPALNDLQGRYGEQGLQVIGIYHPKPAGHHDEAHVKQLAQELGFRFPVCIDSDWKALKRWWLSHGRRGWTSVSFLVDKEGTIRYVHPGGEYHEGPGGPHWTNHSSCRRDYRQIEKLIVELLAR